MKLPKKHILNLMWEALDEMQSYNGRSKQTCILIAMNAEEHEDFKKGGSSWKLPSMAKLKRDTETMLPY
jgi:hypothetical protein